ncbi:hypothetical protein DFJ77DRAFT_468596 [Powellomyces hirtus]|nr:hypothetical protein DFJ77DRAFT_468596 [Powellomyces hirtus]
MAMTSIAFAIDLADDAPVIAPIDAVPPIALSPVAARRLTPVSGMKGSLSSEAISTRLNEAAERKQNHLLSVSARAGQGFVHAKQLASTRRSSCEQKLSELQAKLDAAEANREELERERIKKCGQEVERAKYLASRRRTSDAAFEEQTASAIKAKHDAAEANREELEREKMRKWKQSTELLEHRLRANAEDSPGMLKAKEEGLLALKAKLDAAAALRDEIEGERVRKLAEHAELVAQRKSGPPSPMISRVQSKLEAAEQRRQEMEQETLDRLQAHFEHVREVREKKAAIGNMGGLVM